MKPIFKHSLVLGLSFLFVSAFSQEFKTPLKVSKGQQFNYASEMTIDITQSMGGQEMKVGVSSSSTIKNTVNNVLADGSVDVHTAAWDAKVRSKMMGMDTTNLFNGQVSPTYKLQLDKYGNILKKEKIDTAGIRVAGANFDVGNNLTSSGMFCEFPLKDLKVSEKWTKEHSDSIAPSGMGGKLGFVTKTEYTLGAKETIEGKELQKITYSSTYEIGGKSKMQGMDLFIEGNGVQNGDMYIDPVSKVIFQNKSNVELDMTIAVSGQQSMTIPMTQKMTVSLKLMK